MTEVKEGGPFSPEMVEETSGRGAQEGWRGGAKGVGAAGPRHEPLPGESRLKATLVVKEVKVQPQWVPQ